MKDIFKKDDCNCLNCNNSIITKYPNIITYECKFNIIQDLEYCFKFRDNNLKQIRNKIKIKKR